MAFTLSEAKRKLYEAINKNDIEAIINYYQYNDSQYLRDYYYSYAKSKEDISYLEVFFKTKYDCTIDDSLEVINHFIAHRTSLDININSYARFINPNQYLTIIERLYLTDTDDLDDFTEMKSPSNVNLLIDSVVTELGIKTRKKQSDNENIVYYGRYPQDIVSRETADILSQLSNIQLNDKIVYRNIEYIRVCAHPYSDDETFSNGEKIIDGKTYYFECSEIPWEIMKKTNSEEYLLSEKIIDNISFINEENINCIDSNTWYNKKDTTPIFTKSSNYEHSDVREYLNNEFLESFSNSEKNDLCSMEIDNKEKKSYISIEDLSFRQDSRIFLNDYATILSYEDVLSFKKIQKIRKVTDYAKARGCKSNNDNGSWNLRTSLSNNTNQVLYVSSDGMISNITVNFEGNGLLPVVLHKVHNNRLKK